MHDLDRTRNGDLDREFEQEFEFEHDGHFDGEFEALDGYSDENGEGEWEFEASSTDAVRGSPFDEAEEMELAAELVEIAGEGDEEELELFIGRLVNRARRGLRKAGRRVRRNLRSRVGRALRGGIRQIARRALPIAGAAIGGPAGAVAARAAGRAVGLELEGLSPEDQEFEVARRIVRVGGEATSMAAAVPEDLDDETAARTAVQMAARKHVPGLGAGAGNGRRSAGGLQSGRWVRRGNKIMLLGL